MPQGLSLHIGLNEIDPAHYGTNGQLAGCHNDARDMAAMAKAQGYQSLGTMLDGDATVKGLKTGITAAARKLDGGDIFFLTYSGHGGQVPDSNADERNDPLGGAGDRKDETWCLYDRMLVDDELYALFGGFRPGVRIAVLSDSCHSGSVTRAVDFGGRFLPKDVLERTYKENVRLYDAVQEEFPSRRRLTVGATIILISGCQDNQTSADGEANGLFTEHLEDVWHEGSFKGTLKRLRNVIASTMPTNQTPNYFVVGAPNRAFERAQAFGI
ncbi:MAG: caspase family protein [Actinomycetota bacterium]